jgi:hypothetical protein
MKLMQSKARLWIMGRVTVEKHRIALCIESTQRNSDRRHQGAELHVPNGYGLGAPKDCRKEKQTEQTND